MSSAGIAPDAVPHLTSEAPGPVLAAGRDADVYALDEERVLRRYRSGRSAMHEVLLMRHVHDHGFPAPATYRADGPDLEMERLHGPTLLQALAAEEVSLADGAQVLADLHTRLHAIPAPLVPVPDPLAAGPSGTRAPLAPPLLTDVPATETVVHLDLNPANIILTEAHGPTLVDWANATTGPAALDIAMTSIIIAEVAVDAGGVYSQAARALLVAFLAAAHVDPRPQLAAAARYRSRDVNLVPGERELVPVAADLVRHYADIAFGDHRFDTDN
ncbi:aminoglycoside phosphotransferase family protein [Cellulomonas sp. P22]|uniref:aminoglycoside phosphotransferase family protein n=1 Tax=Cellulomonas sp. P22 TaxID=3373189 RepID=UPI0037BC7811